MVRVPDGGAGWRGTARLARSLTAGYLASDGDDLIQRFYAAFSRLDGETMAACYPPAARFSDPVFTDLHDHQPGAMWKMLTGRAKDFTVELVESEADDQHGRAHWLADYTFSTGRRVHNDVRTRFRFDDGLIVEHEDLFSFYASARQARGPVGLALGWTPMLQGKVRREARAGLDAFSPKPSVALSLPAAL